MGGDQLSLLLWKNYVVRKRQPGILALVFIWPVMAFLILYTIRDNVDPEYNPTCQFPARMMPQDGLLPFVQSFICSVDNPCNPLSEYEEVPSYRNSKLGPVMAELQGALENETIFSVVKSLPKSIRLLKSMAQILTQPGVKEIFEKGIQLGDLFKNHDRIKRLLRTDVPDLNETVVDNLFNTSIKLQYLIQAFGSSNMDDIICTPNKLEKYLVLSTEEDVVAVSEALCAMNAKKIPQLLEHLSPHLDFTGILKMLNRVMTTFRNYDLFDDLQKTVDAVLKLKMIDKYVPRYLRLEKWLPKIIVLFKNVTFKEIDLTFIDESVKILDPIFGDEGNWKTAKDGFLKLNALLGMVKNFMGNESYTKDSTFNIYNLVQSIGNGVQKNIDGKRVENISQILDATWPILQDGIKLTNLLIREHRDEIQLGAEVLDGLTNFLPKNLLNTVTYAVSLLDNMVQVLHHVATLHLETPQRIYDIAQNHKKLVQQILNDLEPTVYKRIVAAFSKLEFVEEFLPKDQSPPEVFCNETTLKEIFDDFKDLEGHSAKIRELFCGVEGKQLIWDLYNSFELDNFRTIVQKTLSTIVKIFFKQPVPIEMSNLTSAVRSVRRMKTYLDSPKLGKPNWGIFGASDGWTTAFNETKAQGRLDVLGIHLSIAKNEGSKSPTIFYIKPSLQKMDLLANVTLVHLHAAPKNWLADFHANLPLLIETFYRTVGNREKVLNILEYTNFTGSYCNQKDSPQLLSFPPGSNATSLKSLICSVAKMVQMDLQMNLTEEVSQRTKNGSMAAFDWTSFDKKVVEIYSHIDKTVHQEYQGYDWGIVEELKKKFVNSWTRELTVEDAWEISIGLICKLFDIMEAPLFSAQDLENWDRLYAIAWASDKVFGVMQNAMDKVINQNLTFNLTDVLHDMPQTEILVEAILSNLADLSDDLIDIATLRNPVTQLISRFMEYKKNETNWPCVEVQSVGRILNIRNGSRAVIRDIERISCNPGLFVKEWQEQPAFEGVRKLTRDGDNVKVTSFNWTAGYTRFRHFVGNFRSLLIHSESIVLSDVPSLSSYIKKYLPHIGEKFDVTPSTMEAAWGNIAEYVDTKIFGGMKIFNSSLSAKEAFYTRHINIEEKFFVFAKFFAREVYIAADIIQSILREVSDSKMNFLPLLGFNDQTIVSIVYKQLPEIIASVVNCFSDPLIYSKISGFIEAGIAPKCDDMFTLLVNSTIGISAENVENLKEFFCEGSPAHFNVFGDYFTEINSREMSSINEYESYIMRAGGKLYHTGTAIKEMSRKGLKIDPPLTREYFEDSMMRLKKRLKEHRALPHDLRINPSLTGIHLVLQLVSEIMVHMTRSLAKLQNRQISELHTWDLAEEGDVRQIIRIFEEHPEETISLLSRSKWTDPKNDRPRSLEEFKTTICGSQRDFGPGKHNRTKFVREICSFDIRQLIESATSAELLETLEGKSHNSQRLTYFTQSLTNLLEAIVNFTSVHPRVAFRSSIFNATTWKNLDNDTVSAIQEFGASWLHKWTATASNHGDGRVLYDDSMTENENGTMHIVRDRQQERILNRLNAWIDDAIMGLDLISGGDVWRKLKVNMDHEPAWKVLLTTCENLPDWAIAAADSFVNSEKLSQFLGLWLAGYARTCDVGGFIRKPKFMGDDGALAQVNKSCFSLSKDDSGSGDLAHLRFPVWELVMGASSAGREPIVGLNKTMVVRNFHQFWSLSLQQLDDGLKDYEIPVWWTHFQEETLRNFLTEYKSKDQKMLYHTIADRISKIIEIFLKTVYGSREDFAWPRITKYIDIVNSQLSNHKLYTDLICKAEKLKFEEIRDTLVHDFQWNKTIDKIKSPPLINSEMSLDDFSSSIKETLHYLVDIIFNFEDTSNHKNVVKCFDKILNGPLLKRPGTYISILSAVLDTMAENLHVLDTSSTHQNLGKFAKLAEKSVPIWKPLWTVVKKSYLNEVERRLPNASINVNMLDTNDLRNSTILSDILNSKRSKQFLLYNPMSSTFPSIQEISEQLSISLDYNFIDSRIASWRREEVLNLTWLKELLKDLRNVLKDGGSLLDVAGQIDFHNVTNALSVPDLVDGVVELLRKKTIEQLFDGLREILDDVDPFIKDPMVREDLRSAVAIIEGMDIFENLGLLNMKYSINDMFNNWDDLVLYLVQDTGMTISVAEKLSQGKVDMLTVFTKEKQVISLKGTVCSPEELTGVLDFKQGGITPQEISSTLCRLDTNQTQQVTTILIKNLNFEYIVKDLMSANVKNILSNANLTEKDGKTILESLGVAEELLPSFKDKLSQFSDGVTASRLTSDDVSGTLSEASELMCGRSLVQDSGKFYRMVNSVEDNNEGFTEEELLSIPTDFCRQMYENVLEMPGGKIIWSYVKPLLRGKILYTPNTSIIRQVMQYSNVSFSQIAKFGDLMDSLDNTLVSLASLTDLGNSLQDLQGILSSEVMKIALKSLSTSPSRTEGLDGTFRNLNFSNVAWQVKNSKPLTNIVKNVNQMMDCILVDRLIGFATEEELEKEAGRLIERNEFLAGVVFLEEEPSRSKRSSEGGASRSKRSFEEDLPESVTYKIRMDVDDVPSTSRLKNQFWTPGPEGSFVEDLRYLRGFVQLQDSIDRAIIRVKTKTEKNWKTLTQQMPYPCWKFVPFQSTLYESQGLQVFFFFAMMMFVGSAVRYIVWERESQNSLVMSVMGLRPWRNTLAWFITTLVEVTIIMICIHIILIAGKILPRSDPVLVLFLMLDYAFAIVAFCYMVSTMFSSASLAAVTIVVLFLMTYMPYVIVIAMEASMNIGFKILICLSMSTSFCFGCLFAVRKEVQGTGLTWGSVWEESSPGDPMSLGLVLIMIALDGCLYAIIGYLVARYTNSGRGFHGLRSRSLWWADGHALQGRPSYHTFENSLYFTNDVAHSSNTHQDSESDTNSLTIQEKQVGVRFEAVSKVFQTEQGACVAVDDFTLRLCEGDVTTLLGQNGAGKTTIIKMVTGMLAPTSGEISLNSDGNTKPNIGVCPQNNVLIGSLTPREHMTFYAKLKKPSDELEMTRNVNMMLASMELCGQENELVCRLSGGTQRRLSVALAFLGSPKLVILDEPGAGVDPVARRRIWRLIDKHRHGRTVLMSTHHLDEADMLSDQVVVMHKGKILCVGSPLTLKMNYGFGYQLTLSLPHKTDGGRIEEKTLVNIQAVLESVVPNAVLNEVTDSEAKVILPFQGKHGVRNDIASAAKVLEDNKELLGFSHFSLECDTLERVFLNLCSKADTGQTYVRPTSMESTMSIQSIGFSLPTDDVDLIEIEQPSSTSPFKQGLALLKKRLWHFSRDWRAPLAALILPTMFVAVAMGFSLIRPPSDNLPPLVLEPKLYDTKPTYFYSIDGSSDEFLRDVSAQLHSRIGVDHGGFISPNDTGTCDCVGGQQVCQGGPQAIEGFHEVLPGRPTLDWIVSTHQQYIEKRYGGWSLSHSDEEPSFLVWYNNKGHHSMPAYLSALNEGILRALGSNGTLTTLNHPLKLTRDQLNRTSLLQRVADVGVALVLLVAFSLVGAQGARELVRERLSEEKRILYLAGVHPLTYWTTAFIWDLLVFGCSICLAVIVFEIFGLSVYVARDNLAAVSLLLFLFAWAVIPFTHLAEKAFDDSSVSNMVLFCVNTFIGVASIATILVIDILGKTKAAEDFRNVLHNILLLFPQYVLGDALVQIARNDITAELLERFHMDTYRSPLGWELIGLHYVFLFLVGSSLYGINVAIECGVLVLDFPWKRLMLEEPQQDEDEDVARERRRVALRTKEDAMRMVNLRKEYRNLNRINVAVEGLSLGLQKGQCFGLLGVNGAGKSTTFRMLTTEIKPTAGKIYLDGKEVGPGPLCSGDVGYCPQSDALDPFLTPYESLTVHGEVCGLRNVPRVVESTLRRFDLTKYAHQRISSLSGGNKRKLCAAISVMAPFPVVLMDEPTSGMDPNSKELVARAVRIVTKNQGCVLMTSHSVAECENLCSRVGVLAKAGLRCIGSPEHLKHKFGEGYIAFLRFNNPMLPSELREATSRRLPGAAVASRQALAARLLVPRTEDTPLSVVLTRLQQLADDLKATDYTLTQSSLDQVLVNFSEELDDETEDPLPRPGSQRGRTGFPNMYSSMDTIHMETF